MGLKEVKEYCQAQVGQSKNELKFWEKRSGKYKNQDIVEYWKNEVNIYKTILELLGESYKPKKKFVTLGEDKEFCEVWCHCGKCGEFICYDTEFGSEEECQKHYKYCNKCGSEIDWSDKMY